MEQDMTGLDWTWQDLHHETSCQVRTWHGMTWHSVAWHGDLPDVVQVSVHKRDKARIIFPLAVKDFIHSHFLAWIHSSWGRLRIVCIDAEVYIAKKEGERRKEKGEKRKEGLISVMLLCPKQKAALRLSKWKLINKAVENICCEKKMKNKCGCIKLIMINYCTHMKHTRQRRNTYTNTTIWSITCGKIYTINQKQ